MHKFHQKGFGFVDEWLEVGAGLMKSGVLMFGCSPCGLEQICR